ncbi:23S rRNA (uracil(1939)-C(5))-methyltransferase RlmD [Celerinatantimonas diazotrophica]|uniref:23S rRNA (uracil(1939)-C(5))-methyltransferase RlmD n=1 Tax=Celerinatantimonas diazotrophica TaxID=412034 RepID=UPI001404FD66|nr:23S rRNA (uracil(1939)-C(5))-methyltransferase RlmD [Celerinatantimonas diazotrophica]
MSAIDHRLQGIIHYQQQTYFAQDVLPEEEVQLKVTGKRKAQLLKVLQADPRRIKPACQYYGQCGGCQGQILSFDEQLNLKAPEVKRLIEQLSGYEQLMPPQLFYGQDWRYRRVTRLATWFDHRRGWQLGFRQSQSKQLVQIDSCLVLQESLNALIPPLQGLLNAFSKSAKLGHVELYDCLPQPAVRLRLTSALTAKQRQLCTQFANEQQVSFFVSDLKSEQYLVGSDCYYQLGELAIHFTPGDFIQVNPLLNEQMVQLAQQWLALKGEDRLLDLYSGVGNFTLPLAKQVRSVVAIEGIERMSEQLRVNAKLNQLNNIKALSGDLDDPKTLAGICETIDKVLLDPARSGAQTALESVAKAGVKAVLYIACDPATMARDLAIAHKYGYKIQRWALINMFSQTSHVETVVLLSAD